MLNSFWRNAYTSSRQVLILSSLLTVASSSNRKLIPNLGHCQPKKVRFYSMYQKITNLDKFFLAKRKLYMLSTLSFLINVNISVTHPSRLLREISGNFQKVLEENCLFHLYIIPRNFYSTASRNF